MNQRISTVLAVCFCALLLFAEVGFAQDLNRTQGETVAPPAPRGLRIVSNTTIWPYGGVPDKSRMSIFFEKVPLNFSNEAFLWKAKFDSVANFGWAKFDDGANFREATFDSIASFQGGYIR